MNHRAERQLTAATAAAVPTVVVFHCDGGSLATPATEPVHPSAGFIRVPCVGRVSSGDVLRALRAGAAGVLLAGCAPGACRFGDAVAHGRDLATDLSPMLEAMGLGAERVRFAATGRGVALTEAVAAFIADVADSEVIRPEPAEVSRMSALMNVVPPYPHHGAVQEAALISHMAHMAHPTRPSSPRRPAWAEGANARAQTLLYVCDLPLLDGLLGRHFPVDMDTTLRSCMALVKRAGVEVSVVPALPCCGHDFALAGIAQERAPEARRVREALGATGARRVVTVSPECEWNLRQGYAELDVAPEQKVVGLVNLLYEHADALVPDRALPPAGRHPAVLYVGDATTESRDSALELLITAGVTPRAVLPREYGADPSQPQPWGFVHCDGEARAAQDRLLSQVEDLGATTLITLSVTAAIHLACAQRRGTWRRSSVRVETLYDHLAARLAPPAEPQEL